MPILYQEVDMAYRISPYWWPAIGAASPLMLPLLFKRNMTYKKNRTLAEEENTERIRNAAPLDLPELDFLEITVLVDEKPEEGFLGDAGVSWVVKSNLGTLLFDVGFGPERPTLKHNAARLGFNLDQVDALAISHLHPDHMGGIKASRRKSVIVPKSLGSPDNKPCYLPDNAGAAGWQEEIVSAPGLLTGGIASTGPLFRSLFFFGLTKEQALVAHVKDKGLVVIAGCSHPTIEVILKMVTRLSSAPLYMVCGGLHFPVTQGRGNFLGIQPQMFIGTGYPPWRPINTDDLGNTINAINNAALERVLLSAHDVCDYSLSEIKNRVNAETDVLKVGKTYKIC